MTDWLRLLLSVFLLVGAGLWSRYRPTIACRFALALVVITVAGWMGGVLTGFLRALDVGINHNHRWLGHLLVIGAWITATVSIGVELGRRDRRSLASLVGRCFLICAALGSCFLAASTGYVNGPEPETQLRFRILHELGVPSVSFALMTGWVMILWRPSASAEP